MDNQDRSLNSAMRSLKSLQTPRQLAATPLTPRTTATGYFYNGTLDGSPPTMDFASGAGNLSPPLAVVLPVYDLRFLSPRPTLLTTGCEVVSSRPTSLLESHLLLPASSPIKSAAIATYYFECEALVRSLTGCTRTIAFHHRYRQQKHESTPSLSATAAELKSLATSPVPIFHLDNSDETAKIHLRRILGEEEAERWLRPGARWAIVNVWRPVGEMVQQRPLVVAWPFSGSVSVSVPEGERAEGGERPEGEGEGESNPCMEVVPIQTKGNYKSHFLAVKPPVGYRFGYVSGLRPEEALVFVNWASEAMRVRGLAHGAVEDHASVEGAPLRRSVEVRILALFES